MKFIVAVIMLLGLIGTLVPKIPGTVIIFIGALLYGLTTNFAGFTPLLVMILVGLMAVAEIGGRWLRVWLTQRYYLSRQFSTNASTGNIAGVVAADTLFGPLLGLLLWELVAGKVFFPRWSTISKVITQLAMAASFRLLCGIFMIILVVVYIY